MHVDATFQSMFLRQVSETTVITDANSMKVDIKGFVAQNAQKSDRMTFEIMYLSSATNQVAVHKIIAASPYIL